MVAERNACKASITILSDKASMTALAQEAKEEVGCVVDVINVALEIMTIEEALRISDAARLAKVHEKDALATLTLDYKAQVKDIQASQTKALKEEFLKGMCHEYRMVELARPDLTEVVVPQSRNEWNKWKATGQIPSSHPNLGSTPPHHSGPKDASNSLNP